MEVGWRNLFRALEIVTGNFVRIFAVSFIFAYRGSFCFLASCQTSHFGMGRFGNWKAGKVDGDELTSIK
jgi:hypothetical protein